jgi:hypothetical protein
MGDLEAGRLRIALAKEEAAALDALLQKKLAAAVESGNEVEAARIRTAMAQNNAVLLQLPPETTQVLQTARRGFEGFFSSLLNGAKSVKQAFKDLGMSIFQSINDIIAKQLGNALFESLGLSGKGGGSIGGWLGGLLGGGGAPAAGGAGGGLIGWLGSLGGSLFGGGGGGGFVPGLASMVGMSAAIGSDYVPRDMLALVHEGEAIIPASKNPYSGGKGGMQQTVSQSFHFAGPVDRRTAMQVGADAQRGLIAARRNL